MNNNILIVKNNTHEGPGTLQFILDKHKINYSIIDLDKGDKFPPIESFDAVVVLGAPDSANDNNPKINSELDFIKSILKSKKPYLGICLGLQTLVKAAGGNVVKNPIKEIGFKGPDNNYFTIELTQKGKDDPLFKGLENILTVFHLHGETVELSQHAYPMELLAQGKFCKNQVVKVGTNAYGLQCHFELTPEMFEVWMHEDEDLKKLNKDEMRNDFKCSINEYLKVGEQLFSNFLTIAGFQNS